MNNIDPSLNNLFFLYRSIANISDEVKFIDRERYKIINSKTSVWPNAIFDLKPNLIGKHEVESIYADTNDFRFDPVTIVQHSEEVLTTLKRGGFLMVDRWTGMSLNLISGVRKYPIYNAAEVLCREIQINELPIWVKLVSEELFSSEILSWDVFTCLLTIGSNFILIEKNNVPIGCSLVFYHEDVAGIYMFCIKKEYRGKGYAKQLLEYSLKVIENNKKALVVLQSTRMGLPLYKSFDFSFISHYNLFIKK